MENKELQTTNQENRLITKEQIKFAENLSLILEDTQKISEQTNPIVKEIMFANAKAQIESLLTDDIMVNIYKLFGDASGVKMDKVYGNDVKKRIFIQASMEGFSVRGNQINVIGGNMYRTAQGYLPKLRKFPNLSFVFPFRHRIPVKDATTFTTTVTTDMEWTLNGVTKKESVTYPVSRQEGQSNDAILGKATTKMCCWLWNKISGEDTIDDSGIYVDAEVVSSKTNESAESAQTSQPSQPSEQKPSEEIHAIMVNDEFQQRFNSYISKADNGILVAKSISDLVNRAKVWCDSKTAKEIGVVYSISDDSVFTSQSLDLKVFNELIEKLKISQ